MSINTFRVRTRQAWQQFISEEKTRELLAPPVRPIPKVIPGLHHRLSVLMLRLWYVTQLHYLYRALPFGILSLLVTLLEPSLCCFQLPVIIQTIIIDLWLCQL
jgi:hypothetical protein